MSARGKAPPAAAATLFLASRSNCLWRLIGVRHMRLGMSSTKHDTITLLAEFVFLVSRILHTLAFYEEVEPMRKYVESRTPSRFRLTPPHRTGSKRTQAHHVVC